MHKNHSLISFLVFLLLAFGMGPAASKAQTPASQNSSPLGKIVLGYPPDNESVLTLEPLVDPPTSPLNGYCFNDKIGWIDTSGLTYTSSTRTIEGTASCVHSTMPCTINFTQQGEGHVNLGVASTPDSYGNFPVIGQAFSQELGWFFTDHGESNPLALRSDGSLAGYLWNNDIGWVMCQDTHTTNTLAVQEGVSTATYTIALDTQPTGTVTIDLTPNHPSTGVTADPAQLTFTTSNWNQPQTVTVTPVQDYVLEGEHVSAIGHAVASTDPRYDDISFAPVTVSITDPDPTFVLWALGDPHIQTDLARNGYKSLENALNDSFHGGDQGGPPFSWDIAMIPGDYTGLQQCPGDDDGLDIHDQFDGAGADPNMFYGIIGNHDAGLHDASFFRKWVDPLGRQTTYSRVDNLTRPYPVEEGEWDHYAYEVGNIRFLMLGDNNFGGGPFGRDCTQKPSSGYPAGRYTKKAYDWWEDQLETHSNKILVSMAHHGIFDTTIYTGYGEGVEQRAHGNHSWADERGSSFVYAIDNWTIDGRDETNTYIGERPYGFKKYMETHPGSLDFWLFGHTHVDLYPGKSFNGRADKETKHGTHFMNLGALTKEHGGPETPYSYVFSFYEGHDQARAVPYLHSNDWPGGKEGFASYGKVFPLRHAFTMHPKILIGESGVQSTITEGGATDMFSVKLQTQPLDTVTVELTSSDTAQGFTVSPAQMIFTPSNWNQEQVGILTAVDDTSVEEDHSAVLTVHAVSSDSKYSGLSGRNIGVHITDNDATDTTAWYDSDWQYRQKITIPSSSIKADLADFPVLITEAGLSSSFWEHVRDDGTDIVMTAGDSVTKLDRELVFIDTDSQKMELYFKAPSLSSVTNTDFYLYYGNGNASETNDTGTWNSDYIGVWHLHGGAHDSTGHHRDGTIYGSGDVPGNMGGAQGFDGTDDGIDIGDIDMSSFTDLTVSAWFSTSNVTDHQRIAAKDQMGVRGNFLLWFYNGQWGFLAHDGNDWRRALYASTAENDGSWHHITGVVDNAADSVRLYMDGTQQATDTFTATFLDDSDNEEFVLGADSDVGSFDHVFDGSIDEVRLMSNAASPEWIMAERGSLHDPGGFYIVGEVEPPVQYEEE